MMSRLQHDPQIIAAFDILGTFFVDVFYNKVYARAKEAFLRGETNTLTEAYINQTLVYVKGIRNDQSVYRDTVTRLYDFYKAQRCRPALTFVMFGNDIAALFFPGKSLGLMSNADKDTILREIITQTTGDFVQHLLSSRILSGVIDDHTNVNNVRDLQDKYIYLFIAKRDTYHEKVIKGLSGKTDGMVSAGAYETLQGKLVKEAENHLRAKHALKVTREELAESKRAVEALTQKLKDVLVENSDFRRRLDAFTNRMSHDAPDDQKKRPSVPAEQDINAFSYVQRRSPLETTGDGGCYDWPSVHIAQAYMTKDGLRDLLEELPDTPADIVTPTSVPGDTPEDNLQTQIAQDDADDYIPVAEIPDSW